MYKDDENRQGAGKSRAGKGGQAARRRRAKSRIGPAADPRRSRSLEYGIAVLESYTGERQALGIADLADIMGTSRSTVHRYATTLVVLGYLEQNPQRKYRLAGRAADPGSAAISALRRQVPARAVLEELREETGHTVSMGVLDGPRIVYIHRLLGHRPGQHAIDRDLGVGAAVPVHCTALGKALLASLSDAERRELLAGRVLARHGPNTITSRKKLTAELDRIGSRGVAVSDEEHMRGSRSVAVLVSHPGSEHPLAIDVTAPSSAYTLARLIKDLGPRVKRAARLLSGE